ncbi:MAG: HlyD family efflux transporter periplasmic adaptor subunit [Acidobacteriota bacterium]
MDGATIATPWRMDREIDRGFRNRQLIKRLLILLFVISFVVAGFVYAPRLMKASINRSRIRTARVEAGAIEATISASGTVVPEFEQVISSPINAQVKKILKRAGDGVRKGEPILELDVNESVLAVEKINQQMALKQNQQAKIKLDLQTALADLQSRWEIKNLEYKSARAATARNRNLAKQGLLSEEKLREAELQEEKAAFELKQLEQSKLNAEQSTRTQIEGLVLEMQTLEKERNEAARQLELATTKADRDGVLTWVVTEEGAIIQKGAVIARIADLNSFQVNATYSDIHAGNITAGMPASIKINDDYLQGTVASILPTVKDGTITAAITLKDKSSALLKANLRVDVLIVTDKKDRVLRIKKGPAITADGVRELFIVRGDVAVKTPVKFGIASFDNCEIVEGLYEGDEVIISDMGEYQHLQEIKLK